ncbi:hypothetical protein [Pseudoxanthomonas putridarboris]|uniref:GPI inositol-deacylase PGAP1-like alpha/beta domain-containing protein n=1 Tax=Pseudoxanthomonas putridarboris TaxID=752605 RepID=A0ABU9J7T5_9GAMM
MSVPPDKMNSPRVAPLTFDAQGKPTHSWNLSPSFLGDAVHLYLPPDKVLPVIFVPGIMGSNLKSKDTDKKTGKPVWRLDMAGGSGLPKKLLGKMFVGAGGRQKTLHPDRTEVDPMGDIPDKPAGLVTNAKDYRNRYWGEVAEGSYHDFLLWLEKSLNGQGWNPDKWSEFGYLAFRAAPKPGTRAPENPLSPGITMTMRGLPGGAEKGMLAPVMSDDLLARANFRMPVYACGYNWLASNEKSAMALQQRINKVMEKYGSRCQQVILVTHSMGGLVARRCAQLPGMGSKIAGIVHGVMPSEGAPVAYRRCKLGMSDEGSGIAASVGALVIGNNGREVTAVFSQAPGALQLLPTPHYRQGWLTVRDSEGKALNIQPVNDPYDDIYLRRDRWWGLVREAWLAPKGGVPIEWTTYAKNIEESRKFHDAIRAKYHANTYVYYGADTAQPSFETITWHIETPSYGVYGQATPSPQRPAATTVSRFNFDNVVDMGENPLHVMERPSPNAGVYGQPTVHWRLRCSKQDGAGDGTVPFRSGAAPLQGVKEGSIQQQFRLAGFDHEGSYKNAGAQQVTLYALVKIAASAKKQA